MDQATLFSDSRHGVEAMATIENPEELFVAPLLDPFRGRLRTQSVVDEVIAHLRSRSLGRHPSLRLVLSLPPARSSGDLAEETALALRCYAAARIREAEQAIRINRFEGVARIPWGAAVAVAVLLLVLSVYALLPPGWKPALNMATPFLTVLIWVAIWIPVEYLLYESWSLKRLRTAYQVLADIEVEIVTTSAPSPEPSRNDREIPAADPIG